jgi:hypothetical protein
MRLRPGRSSGRSLCAVATIDITAQRSREGDHALAIHDRA